MQQARARRLWDEPGRMLKKWNLTEPTLILVSKVTHLWGGLHVAQSRGGKPHSDNRLTVMNCQMRVRQILQNRFGETTLQGVYILFYGAKRFHSPLAEGVHIATQQQLWAERGAGRVLAVVRCSKLLSVDAARQRFNARRADTGAYRGDMTPTGARPSARPLRFLDMDRSCRLRPVVIESSAYRVFPFSVVAPLSRSTGRIWELITTSHRGHLPLEIEQGDSAWSHAADAVREVWGANPRAWSAQRSR